MTYLDTPVCEWHWNQLGIPYDLTVAVFHLPCPFKPEFQQRINWAVETFKTVIILCSELHTQSVDFISTNQHPNLHYFICGVVNSLPSNTWMDWFITTREIYKNNNLLDQLTPYSEKSKYFDALLGWAKPHRQIVYEYLKNNNKVILTYLQDRTQSLTESGWIAAENCPIDDSVRNTISHVSYNQSSASISQIIPFGVYNQSAYSVVAETNYDNGYSFYTEKIVKPILAERLFVVFSGQHYLKNLRSMGFKTFDGIIDESYDLEADNHLRFSRACEQINYLLNIPQSAILEQIQEITKHNKKVMLETDWLGHTHSVIKNIISQKNQS